MNSDEVGSWFLHSLAALWHREESASHHWSLCDGGSPCGEETTYFPKAQIHESMTVDARTYHKVHAQQIKMPSGGPMCSNAAADRQTEIS